MKPTLGFKLTQSLALTPQLQQSIRLLQLSTLELNQEIQQALEENPLLERVDDPQASLMVSLSSQGSLQERGNNADPMAGEATWQNDVEQGGEDRSGAELADWGAGGMSWGNPTDPDDDREDTQLSEAAYPLRDHLMTQLRGTRATSRDKLLVAVLIDSVDENGYLQDDLSELVGAAARLLDEPDDPPTTEDMSCALKLLQSFDPAGVGARTASESLALQILHSDAKSPIRQLDRKVAQLALHLVRHHLPLVAARDFTRIKRLVKADDETLRAAHAAIKLLNPHPGARFASTSVAGVVPDVCVVKTRQGWQARLNPAVMPRLAVNGAYAQVLKENRGKLGEAGAQLSARLSEARWLIKNVEQRFDTILKVSQAIVARQKAFFTHGEVAMRPLVLREIADQLGMHESTISRVTTQKFMLTPMGTFELKYFFGSSLSTETGGVASSTAIRALIKQMVAAEDPKIPLSDSRIAELLSEQGVIVARRTVAKYREGMKIAQVHLRKTP
jgi:RNA polymerase sigma-54 factor